MVLRASERRFAEVAQRIDRLLVTAFDDSFEALAPKFKALERQLLNTVVKTASERREVRRRIAETLFTEAFARDCPWPVLGPLLRRIRRLGYSHVGRRYHVACLYAMWCQRHPEHDPRQARLLLDEAERSALRLPRTSRVRQELLRDLAGKRRETGL